MKPKPARSSSVISSSPSITVLTQPPSMRSTGAPPVSSAVSESVQIPTSTTGTSEISEPPSKKAKYADLFSEFVQFMEHRKSVSSRVSSQPSNPVPIYTTAVSNSQYPVRPVLPSSVYGQIPQASSVAQVVLPSPPPPPRVS